MKAKIVSQSPPADLAVLLRACEQAGYEGVPEYAFHPTRRWRFDLAFLAQKVAFERHGGTWQQGHHTRGAGFRDDRIKVNTAQIAGWLVIEATADMIESGLALTQLLAALEARS